MPTTKKPAPQLLASAGTIEDIEKLINRYWFSGVYTVNRSTLAIERPDKPTPAGFRVIHKRGRFRFELLADESASVRKIARFFSIPYHSKTRLQQWQHSASKALRLLDSITSANA